MEEGPMCEEEKPRERGKRMGRQPGIRSSDGIWGFTGGEDPEGGARWKRWARLKTLKALTWILGFSVTANSCIIVVNQI